MLYFNLLSSDIIKEGADYKYTCLSQKTEFTLGLTLFENSYSSCQCGVATANVQLLLWLLSLVFS